MVTAFYKNNYVWARVRSKVKGNKHAENDSSLLLTIGVFLYSVYTNKDGFLRIFLSAPVVWGLSTMSFQNFKAYFDVSIKSSSVGENGLATQYSSDFTF